MSVHVYKHMNVYTCIHIGMYEHIKHTCVCMHVQL